ncbi:unnamed protein product [Schistosoma haematobium]|nr:unnamed protein product [Schistosoma haematobium]
MLYDQVTPRPNVWKANISAIQECAAKTNWLVDTSISVEEAWSVFKAENDAEKAEALSEYFSKVFSIGNEERPMIRHDRDGSLMDPVVIEKDTVLRLLQHLKPDKSSGPDDIQPRIMKAISDEIAEPLAILFDMSLRQSRLPRDWKDAIISLVYKAGSRDLVSNYRLVSLTSAVVKLMEKIIRIAVINYVEGQNLFSREQHGFQKGLSCLTNLLVAREEWVAAKDRNAPVDVIFIDLSKAFDKVSHSGLKFKLKRFGIQ